MTRRTLAFFLTLASVGCQPPPDLGVSRSAVHVAEAYAAAVTAGDWGRVYALASAADRAERDSAAYVAAQSSGAPALEQRLRTLLVYERVAETVLDSTATVTFDRTGPDLDALMAAIQGDLLDRAQAGETVSREDIEAAALRENVKPVTTRETVALVLERDGWRVDHGWDEAVVEDY